MQVIILSAVHSHLLQSLSIFNTMKKPRKEKGIESTTGPKIISCITTSIINIGM